MQLQDVFEDSSQLQHDHDLLLKEHREMGEEMALWVPTTSIAALVHSISRGPRASLESCLIVNQGTCASVWAKALGGGTQKNRAARSSHRSLCESGQRKGQPGQVETASNGRSDEGQGNIWQAY